MIFPLSSTPSEALIALIESRNDDGTPPLRFRSWCAKLAVERHDGSDLSPTEAAHVRGVLAAHAVEPIR